MSLILRVSLRFFMQPKTLYKVNFASSSDILPLNFQKYQPASVVEKLVTNATRIILLSNSYSPYSSTSIKVLGERCKVCIFSQALTSVWPCVTPKRAELSISPNITLAVEWGVTPLWPIHTTGGMSHG